MREVGLHGLQVAVVDAQQRVAGVGEADVVADLQQPVDVMGLDDGRHVQLAGQDHHVQQMAFLDHVGDEQQGVGAGGSRLPDLVLIDDEVLAEHGQRHRLADLLDVPEVPAEVPFVGEARNRGRSGLVVLSGDADRIEVVAD